jgi:hypothetical protein
LRSLPNFPNEYTKVSRYCPTYFGFSGDCTGRISHGLSISAYVPIILREDLLFWKVNFKWILYFSAIIKN